LNLYEMTYILRSDADEDAVASATARIEARLNDAKGEVVKSEAWGRRRLAFPIDRVREGFYFTSIMRMPGSEVRSFEAQLKLIPEVLRFLLIEQEERNVNLEGSLLPASHRPAPAIAKPAEGQATTAEGGDVDVAVEGVVGAGDESTPADGIDETAAAENKPAEASVEAVASTEEPESVDAPVAETEHVEETEATAAEDAVPSGEAATPEAPADNAPAVEVPGDDISGEESPVEVASVADDEETPQSESETGRQAEELATVEAETGETENK
jgi:small subunit ribosomal protein S6